MTPQATAVVPTVLVLNLIRLKVNLMARASKVEACMICEQVPCACNAKPSTRKTSLKQVAVQKPKVETRVIERAAPPPLPKEELVELACIRVLAPILHIQELTKYGAMLASPPTPQERSAIWKARRVNELAKSSQIQG